jgi:hypothetical protein
LTVEACVKSNETFSSTKFIYDRSFVSSWFGLTIKSDLSY